jgi:hypothetical protein
MTVAQLRQRQHSTDADDEVQMATVQVASSRGRQNMTSIDDVPGVAYDHRHSRSHPVVSPTVLQGQLSRVINSSSFAFLLSPPSSSSPSFRDFAAVARRLMWVWPWHPISRFVMVFRIGVLVAALFLCGRLAYILWSFRSTTHHDHPGSRGMRLWYLSQLTHHMGQVICIIMYSLLAISGLISLVYRVTHTIVNTPEPPTEVWRAIHSMDVMHMFLSLLMTAIILALLVGLQGMMGTIFS